MKAELIDVFGNDLLVANTARVSMGKWHTEFDTESDTRLIHYLARENHWSPFAHPKAMFRLELPIFVARQWEKHRIGVVRGYDIYDQNEVSRRYVDDEPGFFDPVYWRERPKGNIKQGSGDFLPEYLQVECGNVLEYTHAQALLAYQRLLTLGVAPEQARMVLPQSTYTQWIETGSLSYWARLCTLRLDPHAQEEIRHLAGQVADQMAAAFPVSWSALMENAHE
jgi:thymidylate synthase (FAD)